MTKRGKLKDKDKDKDKGKDKGKGKGKDKGKGKGKDKGNADGQQRIDNRIVPDQPIIANARYHHRPTSVHMGKGQGIPKLGEQELASEARL